MLHRRVAVLLALAVVLAGCGTGASPSSASGGTLTLGAIVAPVSFDPTQGEWGNRAPFYEAVFDTVLRATPEGDIEPSLATDWSYDDDNTVLTLTLRDDVVFTDGSSLTADVVKQNLERFRDGGGPNASRLAEVTDVTAIDEHTVELTLSAPNPALLGSLTQSAGLIASAESFDDPDLATTPVGSGPYTLDTDATVTGTSYVYARNPDYWDPDVQHYDRLVVNVFEDPTAALNAIRAGEADAVKLINNDNLVDIESAGWTVSAVELDFQGLLLFDRGGTMEPALGDVRVRQALNHAFDREALLDALHDGHGTVTGQVFPPRSPAFDPALDDYYGYDPERARELLTEAGYADGLTLSMPSAAVVGSTTYTLIAQQLADVGIDVEYTDPGQNFIADALAPKFGSMWMSLQQDPDWQLINFMLAPNASWNPFGYEDDTVNDLIEQIQSADGDEQESLLRELNTYIVEQAWFAPFYRVEGPFASNADTAVEMMPSTIYPSLYDIRPNG